MATIKRFEDLEIWQESRQLAKVAYTLAQLAKSDRDFDLQTALPKTTGSVMDNIAEGFCRGGNKEFAQFLSIAHASCGEVKSQLYRLSDRPYIEENIQPHIDDCERLRGKINTFMKYLKKSEMKGYKYLEDPEATYGLDASANGDELND